MKYFKSAIESLSHGMIIFKEDDTIRFANSAARRFLPFLTPEDEHTLRRADFVNFFYDNALECDEAMRSALLKSSMQLSVNAFREVIPWGDNRICVAEVFNLDEGGAIITLSDVSNLHDSENHIMKLSDLNFDLYQGVQSAGSGIAIMKESEPGAIDITFANDAFLRIFKIDRKNALTDFEVFLSKIEDAQARSVIANTIHEARTTEIEFKIQNEGHLSWINFKLSHFGDMKKRRMYLCVFNDITETRRREAELMQVQKLEALGQLSAGIAHDFNNMLSIIGGFARMASHAAARGEDIASNIEKIIKTVDRGADLTRRMLTFGRHKVVGDTIINISEFIADQEVLLRPILDSTVDLRFEIDANTHDAHVECSSDDMACILMNLIVNARDAMPGGGEIRIRLSDAPPIAAINDNEKDFVLLEIKDNGTGIPEHVRSRIFEPFFTTKEQGKGTGLGLPMIYGIVTKIGGYIDVRTATGKGTSFLLYLPRSKAAPSRKISGRADDVASIRLDGYTALVADDEPDLALVIQSMLQARGMNVFTAHSGHAALAVQEDVDGPIDLLLTDIVMPELSGVRMASLFAALRPEAKVIFMSGYPARKDSDDFILPEGAVFLAKPLREDDLVRAIYSVLTKPSANLEDSADTAYLPRWQTGSQKK